ncbi:MAG TPA: cytochrome bc complex cytochrome b subunit [Blastocatellia bacterium]|nr:cytochrome bc complex cytochrome b subunit [Blastocatellia bacterium]
MSTSRKAVRWLEERLNLTEIFSFFTTFGLSYGSIDLNKPIEEAAREAFTRELPAYTRGPYILGVLTFLVFVFQGVTGLMLAFYYQPSAETAYESTLLIIREVNFGWYVHQMHYWGGNALIALLAVRLVRFFVHGVYKAPRELFWVFGVVLLFLSVNAALTGSLLPWDQQSYWSVTRGLEVIGTLPVVGYIASFLVGGFDLLSGTLLRFYVLHIIFIPLMMLFFFYLHFATVRRVGLSALPGDQKAEAKPLYPDHLIQLVVLSLILFGAILTLGTLFPSQFWLKADPFTSPAGIKPPWYMMPAYSLIELIPHWLAGVILLLAMLGLVLLPFIERAPYQELRKRPILAASAAAFCLAVAVLAIIGYWRGN